VSTRRADAGLRALWTTLAALSCAVTATAPLPATAQTAAGVTVATESYRFTDPAAAGVESITLRTVPFAVRLRNSRFGVDLSGAYAIGTVRAVGEQTHELAGPTDVDVRASLTLGRDLLVLAATLSLPTGKAGHSVEEAAVAGLISADLLPFRISNWGSGGGAGVSAAFAVPVEGFGIGMSAGYRIAREFEPLTSEPLVYQPGDEVDIRVAVDRAIGTSGKLALQLAAQRFGNDAMGGDNLYRSGNRVQAIGSYSFAAGGQGSGVAYAGLVRRAQGTYLDRTQTTPSQDLVLAGGGVRRQVGRIVVTPSVDTRFFRSADGIGQGWNAGFGGSAELPLASLTFVPSARVRTGKVLVREDAETGLSGVDLGFSIRFGR
jgi:hypothetical protein